MNGLVSSTNSWLKSLVEFQNAALSWRFALVDHEILPATARAVLPLDCDCGDSLLAATIFPIRHTRGKKEPP
jgi:hypothetical protein